MINIILFYFIKNDKKFPNRFQIILEFEKKIKNVLLF
jgi:hypothetical protein